MTRMADTKASEQNQELQLQTERAIGDMRKDLESLRKELSNLKDDASTGARNVAEAGKEAAHSGAGHVLDRAREGADSVAHSARVFADRAEQTHTQLTDYTRKHPTTSLLVAAGLGAVAARLLSRL